MGTVRSRGALLLKQELRKAAARLRGVVRVGGAFYKDTGTKTRTLAQKARKLDQDIAQKYKAALAADSKGQPLPPGVKRLPSGRLPANYRWAGKTYNGSSWTKKLAKKYPDGVKFTEEGYPDFSPYATDTVVFKKGFAADSTDETLANMASGYSSTPDGFTWHHVEDGQTMQLIPSDLHDAVRHAGGVALSGGN
jgi:hypothetical protein